jgi:hypothetical protein
MLQLQIFFYIILALQVRYDSVKGSLSTSAKKPYLWNVL